MTDQIEEIKNKTDIVSVIGERIQLKKAGRNYKALCPFHGEKTPSFMISSELQIFKCFGCGKGGDVFNFLEEYEGMEFFEALKYLADRIGVKLDTGTFGNKGEKEKLFEINSFVNRFYQYILLKHELGKKALSYLTERRSLTLDTIKFFRLGYAPDDSGLLKNYIVGKKGFQIDDLAKSGVLYLNKNLSSDRFRGRVIFPLVDHRGNTVGFAGRILPDNENKDLAKYINSPETSIYHKSGILYGLNYTKKEIKKTQECVIVEGELDLISSWQSGIKNIVAIKGSALTDEQLGLLSRYSKKIVLAFDADLAGNQAARKGIEAAEDQGLSVSVAKLGKYKDPDEVARKNPEELKRIISSSVQAWDYILESIFEKYNFKTSEGKMGISKEIVPVLSLIKDSILRAHYINIVSKRLEVPYDAVSAQVEKTISKDSPGPDIEKLSDLKKDRKTVLEERLLSIIFQFDPREILDRETKKLLVAPLAKKIINHYDVYLGSSKSFDIKKFIKTLPKELVDGFGTIVLEGAAFEDNYERALKEIELIKKELILLSVRENLMQTKDEIKRHELDKNLTELRRAEQKFDKLTKTLVMLEAQKDKSIIL